MSVSLALRDILPIFIFICGIILLVYSIKRGLRLYGGNAPDGSIISDLDLRIMRDVNILFCFVSFVLIALSFVRITSLMHSSEQWHPLQAISRLLLALVEGCAAVKG
jgi:hypothetical protein